MDQLWLEMADGAPSGCGSTTTVRKALESMVERLSLKQNGVKYVAGVPKLDATYPIGPPVDRVRIGQEKLIWINRKAAMDAMDAPSGTK